jgi:hypothetical protein
VKRLIVSFGGGVNSAGMLVGMRERDMTPAAILFADTGGEKPETYDFLKTMSVWTSENFGLEIVTVRNSGMYGQLERECLDKRTLPSLVFGWRSCSDKYKLRPQKQYAKGKFPSDEIKWAVGIDAGELHRIGKFENCIHPLVEWGWDRDDCMSALRRALLPVPSKSACFYCPASTKSDVLRLRKNHPELFDRAVAMEKNTTGLDVLGLGRHWSWDALVKADEAQFKMFPEAPEIPCMCFDG